MAVDRREVETELDGNLLAVLPRGGEVVSVSPSGLSDYCTTHRIEVRLPNGSTEVFFEKQAKGDLGREMIRAAWTADNALYEFIPEHVPRPLARGRYSAASAPDTYFFLAEFVDMIDDEIPGPKAYAGGAAALHGRSMGRSPVPGHFGFAVNTRFGDLEQRNGWNPSWQAFWTGQMHSFLEREEEVRGPCDPDTALVKRMFLEKVLPRYLAPLEAEGRVVQPCLLHGDLWPGNVKYKADGETVCIYDASALWGHNEVDLRVFRNPRYPLGRPYLKEYFKSIPVSEPEEDFDSRGLMYLAANQILLSTLYPEDSKLRDLFIANMKTLCERVMGEEATKEATPIIGQLPASTVTVEVYAGE